MASPLPNSVTDSLDYHFGERGASNGTPAQEIRNGARQFAEQICNGYYVNKNDRSKDLALAAIQQIANIAGSSIEDVWRNNTPTEHMIELRRQKIEAEKK